MRHIICTFQNLGHPNTSSLLFLSPSIISLISLSFTIFFLSLLSLGVQGCLPTQWCKKHFSKNFVCNLRLPFLMFFSVHGWYKKGSVFVPRFGLDMIVLISLMFFSWLFQRCFHHFCHVERLGSLDAFLVLIIFSFFKCFGEYHMLPLVVLYSFSKKDY